MLGVGGLVFVLHSFQMKRHAAGQLELAEQASEGDDAREFLAALQRYLSFDPSNKEVRARYALALADRATDTRRRWRALQVLRQVIAEDARPVRGPPPGGRTGPGAERAGPGGEVPRAAAAGGA